MHALAVDVVSLYDFALPDARAIKLAATRDAARAREWNASFRWLSRPVEMWTTRAG